MVAGAKVFACSQGEEAEGVRSTGLSSAKGFFGVRCRGCRRGWF